MAYYDFTYQSGTGCGSYELFYMDRDALNRLLFAWVEGVYHRKPHRGIDRETPLDRWLRLSEGIRPLPETDATPNLSR